MIAAAAAVAVPASVLSALPDLKAVVRCAVDICTIDVAAASQQGILVTQASSPYYARETFWCINQTLISTAFNTLPYRVNVPAFGEWGFILASRGKLSFDKLKLPLGHQFISPALLQQATVFDADTSAPGNSPVSSLETPHAWRLYRKRVRYWRN